MDVSYVLSVDEIYTLMSLVTEHTEAGQQFGAEALPNAMLCDLDGLVEKKMAKHCADGQMELTPVIRMLTESMACADSIERIGNGWLMRSPWVTFSCEVYPYKEKHYKITPIKEF